MTAFTMLVKLSSVSIMSDASFATSVPAIPCDRHVNNNTNDDDDTTILGALICP